MYLPDSKLLRNLSGGALVSFAGFCVKYVLLELQEDKPDSESEGLKVLLNALRLVDSDECLTSVSAEDATRTAYKCNQIGDSWRDPYDAVAYSTACAMFVLKYVIENDYNQAETFVINCFKNAQYYTSSEDEFYKACQDKLEQSKALELSNETKVFISYSSRDRGFVSSLCENLILMGIPVWFDKHENLSSGTKSEDELKKLFKQSIKSCASMIILLDEHSLNSRWVNYEVNLGCAQITEDPGFSVIPIINFDFKGELPDWLEKLDPVVLTSGYKTGLSKVFRRLDASIKKIKGPGIRSRKSFEEHMRNLEIGSELSDVLLRVRNCFAKYTAPRVTDIVSIIDELDSFGRFDRIFSGNLPIRLGQPGVGFSVLVSIVPAFNAFMNPMQRMNETVDLTLVSLWPSSKDMTMVNAATLTFEYNPDGNFFMWLSFRGKLHRYTLGAANDSSRLLTEKRQMGLSQTGILWPNKNPNDKLLFYRQALANKLGLGQVQQGQNLDQRDNSTAHFGLRMFLEHLEPRSGQTDFALAKPEGRAASVWKKVVDQSWNRPEVSQSSAIMGHIKLGGIFIFDDSKESSISSLLANQMEHLLMCAGARIYHETLKYSGHEEFTQRLSCSELQLEFVEQFYQGKLD